MRGLKSIVQTALCEWENALRSRRALVLLLLYLAAAVLCMNGTISVLGKMETELVRVLKLPDSGQTGVVSETLWKSKAFRNMVATAVDDRLVFEDISRRHPVELLYAWFAFLCAPILVVLVSGTRVADDLRTGVARYMLMRVTRLEWSLGKYVGQALMIMCALAVSAFGAWCVALYRLPTATAVRLLPPMLCWGVSAWFYSLAWLGIALGLSHLTRSGMRATAFGILAIGACEVLPHFFPEVEQVVPSGPRLGLWRTSFTPQAVAAFHLLMVGLTYLTAGAAVFGRRDA